MLANRKSIRCNTMSISCIICTIGTCTVALLTTDYTQYGLKGQISFLFNHPPLLYSTTILPQPLTYLLTDCTDYYYSPSFLLATTHHPPSKLLSGASSQLSLTFTLHCIQAFNPHRLTPFPPLHHLLPPRLRISADGCTASVVS